MFNKKDNYKKIYIDFMNINKIKDIISLGLNELALAQYLYTVSNGIGILFSTPHTIANNLNISERKAKTLLKRLEDIDYIRYNSKEGIIWIVDMLKYTSIIPEEVENNRNMTRLFKRYISELENTSEIKIQFYEYYKESYPFLFGVRIKEKTQKIKEVENINSFVDIYNIIVEGKGKKRGYLSKNVKAKIKALKDRYDITPEVIRDYALNDGFYSQYSNISELLDIIEKDLLMAKLDTKNKPQQKKKEEAQPLPEDLFIDNNSEEPKQKEQKEEQEIEEEEMASDEDLKKLTEFLSSKL